MKITIRNAHENDTKRLSEIALISKKNWDYPQAWYKLWEKEFDISVDFIKNNKVIVAVYKKNILGFAAVSFLEKSAELEHLWILPEYLHKGIGKNLFLKVLKYCKENNISDLKIVSDPNATDFYKKMGARQIGFIHSTPKPRKLPLLILKI